MTDNNDGHEPYIPDDLATRLVIGARVRLHLSGDTSKEPGAFQVTSKGKRLPKPGVPDDLAAVRDTMRAFVHNPSHPVPSIHQFQRAAPIDLTDTLLELVPEAYLEQAAPTEAQVAHAIAESVRGTFAYLVKINKAVVSGSLLERSAKMYDQPHGWERFTAEDVFDLSRGHFHSIADLDPGDYPTISRIGSDNGLVGFFDKPDKAKVWRETTIYGVHRHRGCVHSTDFVHRHR